MSKFSNYLLVSDFDRTLTDRRGQIPQANLDAIAWFIEQGGAFTIATGRSLPMSRYRFADIPMNAPLLFCNGAGCVDLKTGELLFCRPMPEDCVTFMQHYEQNYPHLRLEVHCLDKHYVFHGGDHRDAYLRRQNADFVHATWDMVPDPMVKFSVYSQAETLMDITPDSEEGRFFLALEEDMNRRGGGRYTAINSLPGMVEVQAAGTSKGLAARELAQAMGRSILVCAGDATNDLSMLEEADLAYLAADGDSRMQNRGFLSAAPCDDGTIADVIRQLEIHAHAADN